MSVEADKFLKGSKLTKLLAGRSRPVREFSVEVVRDAGPEPLRLAVRTLSAEEIAAAQMAARRWLTSTGGWSTEDLLSDTGDALLNLETMVQILARALVDPDNHELPFASAEGAAAAAEVRKCFDADEIRACFDEYSRHAQDRSPFRKLKTLDEVREVADALGKGLTAPTALQRFDATSLQLIITELAARVTKLTTRTSSATSPPTSSPPDSSETSAPPTPRMTVEE